MNIKEALKELKIDLTTLVISPQGGYGANRKLTTTSKMFLNFAKEDFNDGTDRGFSNSLSNAKRAIDSQVDSVLTLLGLANINDQVHLEKMIHYFEQELKPNGNIPKKLKVIRVLNLAPIHLLTKYRALRNQLEHEYKIPTGEEVREAIDVADLFIRVIEGKYKTIDAHFMITDKKNKINEPLLKCSNGLVLSYNKYEGIFKCRIIKEQKNDLSFDISPANEEYYGLIRLMNSIGDDFEINKSLSLLLYMINHNMPIDKAKITQFI